MSECQGGFLDQFAWHRLENDWNLPEERRVVCLNRVELRRIGFYFRLCLERIFRAKSCQQILFEEKEVFVDGCFRKRRFSFAERVDNFPMPRDFLELGRVSGREAHAQKKGAF